MITNIKSYIKTNKLFAFVAMIALVMSSCEIDKSLNDNPNEITLSDVDARLFLNGAMLANTQVQVGHLNRISAMFSGQNIGFTSLYSNIYTYALTADESNDEWNAAYVGVTTNARYIRNAAPDDKLLVGIAKVLEANAIGTLAILMGDVPYSEIGTDVEDPKFDTQKTVLASLSALLDEAIADLTAASSRNESFDIVFNGDKSKWIEAAYTLKARYALIQSDYSAALSAANNGISSSAGDMMYHPRGDAAINSGDKNLFYTLLAGSRTGDIGNAGSYLLKMLNPAESVYRGNAKTNELARHNYYMIDENSASGNTGVAHQFESQPFATYSENQLIKAEAAARTSGFAAGLSNLNTYRAWLAAGGRLNSTHDVSENYKYDAYVEADFTSGGMENADRVTKEVALLREILEERYISLYGSYGPFNDHRRLRGDGETNLIVPFPLNTQAASKHVERFPYAQSEKNSNSNVPVIADQDALYTKTEVNK